jgi:hypothetical protein
LIKDLDNPEDEILCQNGKDTGYLMLDAGLKKKISFEDPVSPPASPEGEADGGQAETGIQHHLQNSTTIFLALKYNT